MAASISDGRRPRALVLVALSAAVLTACGGGSGTAPFDRDAGTDAPDDVATARDAAPPDASAFGDAGAGDGGGEDAGPSDASDDAQLVDGGSDAALVDASGDLGFDASDGEALDATLDATGPGPSDAAQEAAPGADASGACTVTACASDWPTISYGTSHAGYNTVEHGGPPIVGHWDTVIAADQTALSPACAENGVAFVTYDTRLGAIDLKDGSVRWTYDFGTPDSVGQPTVAGGTAYVQTNKGITGNPDSLVWAIDAAKGTVVWTVPFDSQWESYWAPTVADGNVYVNGGRYGGLYAFGVADGSQLFFDSNFPQCDSWSPAYYQGVLYTYVQGSFTANNPTTGAEIWNNSIQGNWPYSYSMDAVAALDGQRAYMVAPPKLAALDLVSQDFDWITSAAFTGTPAVADGIVYATSGGTLVASDASTGKQLFTFAGDSQLSYPPVVAAGVVYASSEIKTFAVNAATGKELWTTSVGGWLSVASGTLMVASANGILHGFVLSQAPDLDAGPPEAGAPSPDAGPQCATITEYPLTARRGPTSITTGPDGNLWFTESGYGIGAMNVGGTLVHEFAQPSPNSGADGITVGSDGNLWYLEPLAYDIVRTTRAGVGTEFLDPTRQSSPELMAAGSDGNLWFTDNDYYGHVNRVTPDGGVTEFATPTQESQPYGITSGPDGNLWFTEGYPNQIAKVTPAGVFTEYPLPTHPAYPFYITAGPDGNIWFTEYQASQIGRITPSGTVAEFVIPTIGSQPTGITSGADGNLWFCENMSNKVARITPSGDMTEFPIPTPQSQPKGITLGPDGNVWFVESGTSKIGKITRVPCGEDAE